jgi:hypothetical protein
MDIDDFFKKFKLNASLLPPLPAKMMPDSWRLALTTQRHGHLLLKTDPMEQSPISIERKTLSQLCST